MTEAGRTKCAGDASSGVAGRGQASWSRPTRPVVKHGPKRLPGVVGMPLRRKQLAKLTMVMDGAAGRCETVQFPARPSPTFSLRLCSLVIRRRRRFRRHHSGPAL